MSSLHERHFSKRWFGFVPRSGRAALGSLLGLCVVVACVAGSFLLRDRFDWAEWLAVPALLILVVWNGFGLARSDW